MELAIIALLIAGSTAGALADDRGSGWNGIPWGSSRAQVEARSKIEILEGNRAFIEEMQDEKRI